MRIRVNSNGKTKKGFTIVELVVALAVVMIMSISATSVILMQNNTYRSTFYSTEATNLAENAIECFRFGVENKSGVTIGEKQYTGVENIFKATFAPTIGVEEGNLTLEGFQYNGLDVEINITETPEGSEKYVLSFVAKQDGKIVLEESYTK